MNYSQIIHKNTTNLLYNGAAIYTNTARSMSLPAPLGLEYSVPATVTGVSCARCAMQGTIPETVLINQ